jgi:putative flippase GtrA
MIHLYKYLTIGVFNTLVGYIFIFTLMNVGFSPELSNFIGYSSLLLVSYILNKKFNFKSKKDHSEELPKFVVSMLIAYSLNLISLMFFIHVVTIDQYLSQILSGIVYTGSGYILSKIWVFSVKKKEI